MSAFSKDASEPPFLQLRTREQLVLTLCICKRKLKEDMHELGVVFHMVDLLEDAAREHGLSRIAKVTVSLGEVSGVVTDFFEDAWLWATQRSDLLKDAELEIYEIEAASVCNDCGKSYKTVTDGRICPHCGSSRTELLYGNELEIDSIEGC